MHLLYDLTELFGLVSWRLPKGIHILADLGGKVFLILSGVCATLGHHPVRRGLQVLGCGIAVSAVTILLWKWGFSDKSILIYFGVLHCLGISMLLWPLFQGCRQPMLWGWSLLLLLMSSLLQSVPNPNTMLLIPFGITPPDFVTGDYYPLLPGVGYFLAGSCLGRRLYREKLSLFSGQRGKVAAALCWVGRNSLPIYLLHQPALAGILFFWN